MSEINPKEKKMGDSEKKKETYYLEIKLSIYVQAKLRK
jgi:hypothetical protein